jgi:5,10-methylenetetrahydrofolate reductase
MKHLQRFRAPLIPIQSVLTGERLIIALEKLIKGALFNCSMCGNCLLQETAFICPLLCPKGLRNGPCGSGTTDHCCVNPSRPCIWHLIYRRAEKMNRLEMLLEVQAPLDWSRVGHETWGTVISRAKEGGLISLKRVIRDPKWNEKVSQMFREIRQPEWWQGDDRYHPPSSETPMSQLQEALQRGEFVVTTEVLPPSGANPNVIIEKAAQFSGLIHAVNVTENAMATARMSSLASCLLLFRQGIDPIFQITGRDYSRLSLQSEVLGAAALGIHNVLCLTGDSPTAGREPAGGLPFDLDATQMLWILRRMRDESRFLDGRRLEEPPRLFIGTAASPNDPNPKHEVLRLKKKINAGAQYIQTQLVYDVDQLQRWLEVMDRHDLIDKVYILIGIGPLHSVKVARFMQERIADVSIPSPLLERMEQSSSPSETGFEIALEIIQKVKNLPGVRGVHIMSLGWEAILPRLVGELRQKQDLGILGP